MHFASVLLPLPSTSLHALPQLRKLLLQNIAALSLPYTFLPIIFLSALNHKVLDTYLMQCSSLCPLLIMPLSAHMAHSTEGFHAFSLVIVRTICLLVVLVS